MSQLNPSRIFVPRFYSGGPLEGVFTEQHNLFYFGLTAAGIACLLYDHLLTFEEERQAIWANPNANLLSKISFVATRYGSEAVGIYTASGVFLCRLYPAIYL